MFPILSRNQIKFIRSLKQKKYRYKFKNHFIEGVKLVSDVAKNQPEMIEYIVIREDFDQIPTSIACDIYTTNETQFNTISHMMNPQGIIAVCKIPERYFTGKWRKGGFALFFDAVQDPGNLGTMLRAAEWYGVKDILIGPGTVDPYSPKVVQAGMGSHSYVNIYTCDTDDLKKYSCPVLAADMNGEDAYDFKWPTEGILILGNEGQGVSDESLDSTTNHITLPSYRSVRTESLNVSMACTSLLTLRQNYIRKKNR